MRLRVETSTVAKEGVQIFRVGRTIIGLYCLQLLLVFGIWLFDNWTTTLVEQHVFRDTQTKLQMLYIRGSGFDYAFIPGYGVYDRFHWSLETQVDDNPPVLHPGVSPSDFPFGDVDIRLGYEEYADEIVLYIAETGRAEIENEDRELVVPKAPK
ncbi:MAG: hypothetical protein ACOCXX_04470 [Planctomycetota bacterium]